LVKKQEQCSQFGHVMRHTGRVAVHRTARARARETITVEIMEAAGRQLAAEGAAALSLRSIARELGMVSSAIYRYVNNRDDLLTRLIIDAYDSLGAAAEGAVTTSTGRPDAERWVATAAAIREWALGRPHEYMLLYGTPVPGYAAPEDTVAPGTRVTLALLSIVRDAATAGRLSSAAISVDAPTGLDRDLQRLAGIVDLPVSGAVLVATLAAWTQLFGLLSFELSNQTRGIVDDHAALFAATARLGALTIGLTDRAAAA
jgi:AcrR family transcriptional regulator